MKRFSFPLDRVLALRRVQRDQQRARLEQLQTEQRRIAGMRDEMLATRERTIRQLAQSPSHSGADFATLSAWTGRVDVMCAQGAKQLDEVKQRIAQQEAVLREAERALRLLERLRERKHGAWKHALSAEEEALAAETFLAASIRLKRAIESKGP